MKYFTPELLARCRAADDDVAETAAARGRRQLAAYNARLQKIRPLLPAGTRRLLRRVSLHDAQYLLEGGAGSELFLTFRLAKRASESAAGVELRYTLDGPDTALGRQGRGSQDGRVAPHVLYDEFDLERTRAATVFIHRLLLSDGTELRIRFSNLRLRWFGRVLLAGSGRSAS